MTEERLNTSFTREDFAPADRKEKAGFLKMSESMSYWKDAWRRLRKNKVSLVALFVILFCILFAFVGPQFTGHEFDYQMRGMERIAPCAEFPFGTDAFGRDYLTRVMVGTQVSLLIGIVASIIVLVIGAIYGAIAGYIGGTVDNLMMRFVDLIYSIPDVLIVILLSVSLRIPLKEAFLESNFLSKFSTIGPGLLSIFIAFGLLYWVNMARIIRGQVLMLKEQEFVTAARALGARGGRIIRKHLLPNCVGQIIVTTMLQIPTAIFLESFLSFLGLGVSPPMASLGSLAAEGLSGIYSYPYLLLIPSIVISIIILAFNVFGDGLRDALDPRLKK